MEENNTELEITTEQQDPDEISHDALEDDGEMVESEHVESEEIEKIIDTLKESVHSITSEPLIKIGSKYEVDETEIQLSSMEIAIAMDKTEPGDEDDITQFKTSGAESEEVEEEEEEEITEEASLQEETEETLAAAEEETEEVPTKQAVVEVVPQQAETVSIKTIEDETSELPFNDLNIFGKPRASPLGPVVSISHSTIEEEEEPEIISYLAELFPDEGKPPIDRQFYVEEYRRLHVEKAALRRKNNYLHKKIAEHYTKRKMDRVFDDVDTSFFEDMVNRYERKLLDFYQYRIKARKERDVIESEINEMKGQRNDLQLELDLLFNDMLAREKEVAVGLIDSKTGKTITDKVVERLITRQKAKSNDIAEIRLAYIRRRNQVREIEAKLKDLETIGGTMHLIEFEQLRMENQNFADKIEERDEELMRLRTRFSNAVQALAHIRVKTKVLNERIEELDYKHTDIKRDVTDIREYVNTLKIQRDSTRAQIAKLKLDSGLLTRTKLLLDMERSINETEMFTKQLEDLKETHKQNRKKLMGIRYNIEHREPFEPKRQSSLPKLTTAPKVYRMRPSLVYPTLKNVTEI